MRGFRKKTINRRRGLPKKGAWTVCRFNGSLVKKNRWCFSGWVDTPMHTMRQESWEVMIFEGIFGFYIDRNFHSNQQLLLIFLSLVCKLYKSLHFGSVKIHKPCLYWKFFCTNIYRMAFFNSLQLFYLHFLVSKL